MKFQIRKCVNPLDGRFVYRVYKETDRAYNQAMWGHDTTFVAEDDARKYVERMLKPEAEVVIAEFGE